MAGNSTSQTFDVVVVGGGPVGLAAALAASKLGLTTALAAPPHPAIAGRDTRTTALFQSSLTFVDNLGAWAACRPFATPLTAIRIVDDMGALLRAPEVTFTAAEQGLDAFGYNVANAVLIEALQGNAAKSTSLTVIDTAGVTALSVGNAEVAIELAEGEQLSARLVVGADGRNSICRTAAGIPTSSWSYPQTAIATAFAHSRPHGGVSTEFHRPAGPLTTVPMAGARSSLVWVETPAEAERLMALSDDAFAAEFERRLGGLLGAVSDVGRRSAFPLSGLKANTFAAARVALVGEAAHVMPPIGAQGLNLGLRDAAVLADSLAESLARGRDIGGEEALAAYDRARLLDASSRITAVDWLNRSLQTGFLPVHLLRGFGLFALKSFPPLRKSVVKEGLSPSFATPVAMSPGGIERLIAQARPQVAATAT